MQVQRFEAGERQRYFADDDKHQLKDLVAQQRYEGADDMDANLADTILRKGKRFRYANVCSVGEGLPGCSCLCNHMCRSVSFSPNKACKLNICSLTLQL